MSDVKTYQNAESSFNIFKMEAIYRKRNGVVDEPHRHDYYTVLLVEQAKGLHKIDFNEYPLENSQVFFVAPAQVHQLIEHEEPKGYGMTFSSDFLLKSNIQISFIEHLNLFHNYGQSPPLTITIEQLDQLKLFCEAIFGLQTNNQPLKWHAIGAYLKLFLIQCNTICSINPIYEKQEASSLLIIRKFKELVDTHFKKEHTTTYYAKQLNVSADHLNRIIKAHLGKTAKEYLQSRLTTEAKRLLYFTPMSSKEIAYELGFSVPANFSAFFKNCTHYSPSQFRQMEA